MIHEFKDQAERRCEMRITKPSQAVLILSIVLAVLALLVFSGNLALDLPAFWLAMGAYLVLLFGNLVRGL
jgi:hypothetical protein